MSRDPNAGNGYPRPADADTEVLGLDLHAATLRLPNDGAAGIPDPRESAGTAWAGAPALAAGGTGAGGTTAGTAVATVPGDTPAGGIVVSPGTDLATTVGGPLAPVGTGMPGVAEVDLTEDPFGDDLPAELAARAPKPWATRSTLVLAALVLVIGGFVAGAQVEKHFGTVGSGASGSAAAAAARAAARAGGFGNGAFGGGGFGTGTGGTGSSGTSTTGTVKLVDGSTIYVQTAAGQVLTVHTTASTPVQVNGSLKNLAPGTTVTVTGPTSSDGTVNATAITQGK